MRTILKDVLLFQEDAPRNLTLDFATMSDGSLDSYWSIVTGKAYCSPSYPTELLTDPSIELWTSATVPQAPWAKLISGTSTVNKESTVVDDGTYSARLDIDASNSLANISQAITLPIYTWAKVSCRAKNSASGKGFGMQLGSVLSPVYTTTTSFATYKAVLKSGAANPDVALKRAGTCNSTSVYIDKCSARTPVLSTVLRLTKYLFSLGITKCSWNIVAASPAGVGMCWDSKPNPLNGLMLVHDGTNLIFDEYLNGVITNLFTTATTYVAGADIEIRHTASTTFKAYYNGSQVGADQTITDTRIINNKYHGLASFDDQSGAIKLVHTGNP